MDDLGQRYYLDVVQVWFKESCRKDKGKWEMIVETI